MIFKPFLIEKIMAGEKTVTRRPSPTPFREGQTVKIQPGMARVSMANVYVFGVRTEPLGDVTDEDAVREGFANRDDFLNYWAELYGGKLDTTMLVDRIEFEMQEAWLDLCPKCCGSGTVNHAMTYEGVALA